jgi:hypothetical protein
LGPVRRVVTPRHIKKGLGSHSCQAVTRTAWTRPTRSRQPPGRPSCRRPAPGETRCDSQERRRLMSCCGVDHHQTTVSPSMGCRVGYGKRAWSARHQCFGNNQRAVDHHHAARVKRQQWGASADRYASCISAAITADRADYWPGCR